MRVFVVDASVAARFLLTEELSDRAARVLEDFLSGEVDLRAPGLVTYEVGNALWKSVRAGFLSEEEASEKFLQFLRLGLASVELGREDEVEVLRWAVESGATYYDAAYVVSAKVEGATLLTADDSLFERAQGETPVLHLRDYPG